MSICGMRWSNFITSHRSISLTAVRLPEQPGGWNVSTSRVLRPKVSPQNSPSASVWISPLFMWTICCLGFQFFSDMQSSRSASSDCESQVKCEVISCLSSLGDSQAAKKVEKCRFLSHTHSGIIHQITSVVWAQPFLPYWQLLVLFIPPGAAASGRLAATC